MRTNPAAKWVALMLASAVVPALAQPGQLHRPVKAVVITGIDSYPGHVWKETSAEIKKILEADKNMQVTLVTEPNFLADDKLFGYDVAVFDFRNADPLSRDESVYEKDQTNLLKFLEQGKGLVVVHWASGAFAFWPEFVNVVGRAQQNHHDKRGPFTVRIIAKDNPITRGISDFTTDDELYYDFRIGNRPVTVLAVAHANTIDLDSPMAMTVQYGNGRVFNTPMGHDVKALQTPEVRELIRRGTAWAAGDLK